MIILDANILIRAVLGARTRRLLEENAKNVPFLAPDTAFKEAQRSLQEVCERRNFQLQTAIAALDRVALLVEPVEANAYQSF